MIMADTGKSIIDRNGETPVFRQIYDILFREIKAGTYNSTGKLPSEKELCRRFDVERNTVRKALQILTDENLVVRVPGIGTRLAAKNGAAKRRMPAGADEKKARPPRAELKDRQKSSIILLITQIDYLHSAEGQSFHYQLIHAFEKRLSGLGFNLLFKPVGQEGILADTIRDASPQGIIFDSFNPDSYYREAAEFGLSCVSVNHHTPRFTSIVSNNFEGAYGIAKMFAGAGHKKIALVTGRENLQTTVERMGGVQTFCASRGSNLKNDLVIPGDWSFDSGVAAAKKILSLPASSRPTAVFAFNDDMAYGCYSVFQAKGLSVPGDISLAGFDKTGRYKAMFPPITTADVNLPVIVDYASWYLSSGLSGWSPRGPAKIQIDTSVCDNGTIGAPP
jgi:DNA-binding LacI/PurR family transcriptional regulator